MLPYFPRQHEQAVVICQHLAEPGQISQNASLGLNRVDCLHCHQSHTYVGGDPSEVGLIERVPFIEQDGSVSLLGSLADQRCIVDIAALPATEHDSGWCFVGQATGKDSVDEDLQDQDADKSRWPISTVSSNATSASSG